MLLVLMVNNMGKIIIIIILSSQLWLVLMTPNMGKITIIITVVANMGKQEIFFETLICILAKTWSSHLLVGQASLLLVVLHSLAWWHLYCNACGLFLWHLLSLLASAPVFIKEKAVPWQTLHWPSGAGAGHERP